MKLLDKLKLVLIGKYHLYQIKCKGERVYDLAEPWPEDDMMPPPMDAQVAFDELCRYFLGEELYMYCTSPVNTRQANSQFLYEIMINYKGDKKYMRKMMDHYYPRYLEKEGKK